MAKNQGLLANPIYHFVKLGRSLGVETRPPDSIVLNLDPDPTCVASTQTLYVYMPIASILN